MNREKFYDQDLKNRLRDEMVKFTGRKRALTDIAIEIGVAKSTFHSALSESISKMPTVEVFVRMAEHYPNIDWSYVFSGKRLVARTNRSEVGQSQDLVDEVTKLTKDLIDCQQKNVQYLQQLLDAKP